MTYEQTLVLEIIEELQAFNRKSDMSTIVGISPFADGITRQAVLHLYSEGILTFDSVNYLSAFLSLKCLAKCPVDNLDGRFEAGSPHQSCHHFHDARDFYGPLHTVNWMFCSDESFNPDLYVEECVRLGIGSPDERQEFLDKTARIKRR